MLYVNERGAMGMNGPWLALEEFPSALWGNYLVCQVVFFFKTKAAKDTLFTFPNVNLKNGAFKPPT